MRNPFFAGLLLLVFASAGCSNGDFSTGCFDCGACGISSPVESPGRQITVLESGVTNAGIAAVDLGLEDGSCIASDRKFFLVSYDAGAVAVSASDVNPKLDTSATSSDGDKVTWTDRNLSMSSERSGDTLLLTFVDAGKSIKVACTGANHAITCKPA